jgi:hypothetical protein
LKTYIIGVATLVLLVTMSCCCGGGFDWDVFLTAMPEVTYVPSATSTPTSEPVIISDLPGDLGAETELLLATTVVPMRDMHDLAIRLSGIPADTPRTVNPEGSPDYPVGTRRLFHVSNTDTDEQFDIYAVLEYKTDHVYMWVEEGASFDQGDLVDAANLFEEHTYVTNRAFFGSEWNPGVDNDPHLSVLHSRGLGFNVAGYYSSSNEFVSAVRADSNEMEMFLINLDTVSINEDFYNGVLSHEFQHMIHWYHDRNEETWLNEGFSELASELNGFDAGGFDFVFASDPDLQLNSWADGPGAAGPNYGAAYLFTTYFLDRFGPEATQALVAHQENSFASVDSVLEEMGLELTHVDVFGAWVVANLLDDPSLGDGRYGYASIDPATPDVEAAYDEQDYPASQSTTVHQYGTDYIELRSDEPLVFKFTGSTQIGLVNASAHSGSYVWWSNRGDDSDMMLTQAFDLSDIDEATLDFWVWYDIEENWDYAYVEVSVDDGQTWTILKTPSGTDADPNGNAFGWGYTGKSDGWINERVDLSDYAGQQILIRFEYITDDAVSNPALILDDVAIPEIGYFSDFEEDAGGWEAAGFVRHANVLPQRWLVQLVLFGPEVTVQRLELNEDNTGEWIIPLGDASSRAVVTISGVAPVTTEMASYSYEIELE